MRKVFITTALFISASFCFAQKDSTSFNGYFYNDEYNIYLNINLYDNNIVVPDHEVFGKLPGYLGKRYNSFYWLITSGRIINKQKAEIELINDYGSEDLKATFNKKNDSTYILHQEDGSTLKVANKGKWQKLPKILEFKKKNNISVR